jgi:hypothetical protein
MDALLAKASVLADVSTVDQVVKVTAAVVERFSEDREVGEHLEIAEAMLTTGSMLASFERYAEALEIFTMVRERYESASPPQQCVCAAKAQKRSAPVRGCVPAMRDRSVHAPAGPCRH